MSCQRRYSGSARSRASHILPAMIDLIFGGISFGFSIAVIGLPPIGFPFEKANAPQLSRAHADPVVLWDTASVAR